MKKFILFTLLFTSTTFANTDFLVVADPHLNNTVTKTSFFNASQDTGTDLWRANLAAIKSTLKKRPVSFALLLGDLPAHHLAEPIKSNSEQQVLKELRSALGALPIVYIPGNNDPLGGNYHSYTELQGQTNTQRPDQLDGVGAWPAHGLKRCSASGNKPCIIDNGPTDETPYFYGSFSVYPTKKHDLRLIALNTVPFVSASNALYQDDDGLSQQSTIQSLTDWLNAELESALKNKERVIIAMHIPPGKDAYKQTSMWEDTAHAAFFASMQKYHDIIIATFTGHTHYDEVRFIRNDANTPSTLVLSTPAVDTGHGNNSAFKIFSLDNALQFENATVYASDANLSFKEQFDYKQAYQSHCDKTLSMHACLDKLDKDHEFYALMQEHYAVGNKGYHHWAGVEDSIHVAENG